MTMVAMHGSRPERPPGRYHIMMDQLMTECWLDNPAERPTANDVYSYTTSTSLERSVC
jgi:hypothetical protein